jgi:hypothetical protein
MVDDAMTDSTPTLSLLSEIQIQVVNGGAKVFNRQQKDNSIPVQLMTNKV